MILDQESAKGVAKAIAAQQAHRESLPGYFPSPNLSYGASSLSVHSDSASESSARPPATVVLARGAGDDETVLTAHLSDNPLTEQPVVLSWAGSGLEGLERSSVGLPPSYANSRRISVTTTFTFSPSAFNTMLLLPPPTAQDSRPLFNVHISLNCFNPGSYITTIRRGASPESGDYIGEFEMGVSAAQATVTVGDQQKALDDTLHGWSSKKRKDHTYISWRFLPDPRRCLVWYIVGDVLTCRLDLKSMGTTAKEPIAVFRTSSLVPRSDGRRHAAPTLELSPKAYNDETILNHIIISALVLERKRLTPHTDAVN